MLFILKFLLMAVLQVPRIQLRKSYMALSDKSLTCTVDDDFTHIQLDGYNCITPGKTSSKKGGQIIYVNSKYTYEVIQNLNNYGLWEELFKISEVGLTKPAIIGNVGL